MWFVTSTHDLTRNELQQCAEHSDVCGLYSLSWRALITQVVIHHYVPQAGFDQKRLWNLWSCTYIPIFSKELSDCITLGDVFLCCLAVDQVKWRSSEIHEYINYVNNYKKNHGKCILCRLSQPFGQEAGYMQARSAVNHEGNRDKWLVVGRLIFRYLSQVSTPLPPHLVFVLSSVSS